MKKTGGWGAELSDASRLKGQVDIRLTWRQSPYGFKTIYAGHGANVAAIGCSSF